MNRLYKYTLAIFLVSLMVSSILINVSTAAKTDNKGPKTRVYLYPRKVSYPKLEIGDTFKVEVRIDNAVDLYAFEFSLKYNPEVLEFAGIGSSFLNSPVLSFKKVDGISGTLSYAISSMYPAESKTGDGILATITFTVKDIGTSDLDLYNMELLNPDIEIIMHDAKDSQFKNEQTEDEVAGTALTQEMVSFATTTLNGCEDKDEDGYCNHPDEDCDDDDPMAYLGAPEVCDRKDNDCDDHIDEPDVCLSGDADHRINSDHYRVGIADLALIASTYGSVDGTEGYEKCTNVTKGFYCDSNDDGRVDIFDLAKVGMNFWKETLAGCVDVNVQFYNGEKILGADVSVVGGQSLGTTGLDGQVTRCSLLDPGPYQVKAMYGGTQYGKDTDLTVDEITGDGSAAIDGTGCTVVNTNPPTKDILIYFLDFVCDDIVPWNPWLATNEAGVAQDCDGGVPSGTHLVDARDMVLNCFGGDAIIVDETHTGFTTITQDGYCSC